MPPNNKLVNWAISPRFLGGHEIPIRWERLWCPLGGSICVEMLDYDEKRPGFLSSPTEAINDSCLSLSRLIDQFRALVLCGPPGAGKTSEIWRARELLAEKYREAFILHVDSGSLNGSTSFRNDLLGVPEWQKARSAGRERILIVDGFDQLRWPGGLPFQSLALALQGEETHQIRLIIGCRAADWDPVAGEVLLMRWGQAKSAGVLELCPLQRSDVKMAAAHVEIKDPDAFMRAITEARLESQAQWPLTLEVLLDQFKRGGKLPASAMENFGLALQKLLADPQKQRSVVALPPPAQARQIVRRMAACMVFGKRQSVLRDDVPSDRCLTVSELIGDGTESQEPLPDGGTFEITESAVDSLLSHTPLFTSHGTTPHGRPIIGFVHQAYAEFLAAEYLHKIPLAAQRQILMVKTGQGESVPPVLAETAAWLAAMDKSWFKYLLDTSPETLLRVDGTQLSSEQKDSLLEKLLKQTQAENAIVFHEVRRLTPSFVFHGLSERLEKTILDRHAHPFARRLAVQVAEQCRLGDLEPALWEVLERKDDLEIRRWIPYALFDILFERHPLDEANLARLDKLVREEMGPDEDDQLKGYALQLLVPRYRVPRDVSPWLTQPKNDTFTGAYEMFLSFRLPTMLNDSFVPDLPALLSCIEVNGWHSSRSFHRRLSSAVIRLSFDYLEMPEIRKRLISLLLSCMVRHGSLLPESEFARDPQHDQIPEHKRRDLLSLAFNETNLSPDQVFAAKRALGLNQLDLGWLLEGLASAPSSRREIWAGCVPLVIWNAEQRERYLHQLISAYNGSSELRSVLGPCREGMNIHETFLILSEEHRLTQQKLDDEAPDETNERTRLSRSERIEECLVRWRAGEALAWLDLSHSVFVGEDGSEGVIFSFSIKASDGWKTLSESVQREFVACARAYLIQQTDPRLNVAKWERTNYSVSGYLALDLLVEELSRDEKLAEHASRKWLRAFLAEYGDDVARQRQVVTILYARNPEIVRKCLEEKLERDNNAKGWSGCLDCAADCWDSRLSGMLAAFLRRDNLHEETFRRGLRFLSERNFAMANEVLVAWLDALTEGKLETGTVFTRAVLFGALFFTEGRLWHRGSSFFSNLEETKTMLLENGEEFGWREDRRDQGNYLLRSLTPDQLGQLLLWLSHFFPEERRRRGVGFTEVTMADALGDVRELVERKLAKEAPERVFSEVRKQLPEPARVSLAFARAASKRENASETWESIPVQELLRLAHAHDARFIRHSDDLLDFVMERIKRFEAKSNVMRMKLLWNDNDTPKHETVLSKLLADWLDEGRQLLVNCEVEPVQVFESHLDLKIQMRNGLKLDVIVEVKKAENREVMDAMQVQLVDKYLIPNQWTHGLYLVAWYGDQKSCLGGSTPKEDEKKLQAIKRKLRNAEGLRIEAMVIDCRNADFSRRPSRRRRNITQGRNTRL